MYITIGSWWKWDGKECVWCVDLVWQDTMSFSSACFPHCFILFSLQHLQATQRRRDSNNRTATMRVALTSYSRHNWQKKSYWIKKWILSELKLKDEHLGLHCQVVQTTRKKSRNGQKLTPIPVDTHPTPPPSTPSRDSCIHWAEDLQMLTPSQKPINLCVLLLFRYESSTTNAALRGAFKAEMLSGHSSARLAADKWGVDMRIERQEKSCYPLHHTSVYELKQIRWKMWKSAAVSLSRSS